MTRIPGYVSGLENARLNLKWNRVESFVSQLPDIVDRAIEYTSQALRALPPYREATVESLRRLRDALACRAPDDPAIARLDAFLDSLNGANRR